jgi:hypothetical protein
MTRKGRSSHTGAGKLIAAAAMSFACAGECQRGDTDFRPVASVDLADPAPAAPHGVVGRFRRRRLERAREAPSDPRQVSRPAERAGEDRRHVAMARTLGGALGIPASVLDADFFQGSGGKLIEPALVKVPT